MLVQLLRMLLNRWRRVLCLWLFISNGTPINNSGENISDKLDGNIGKEIHSEIVCFNNEIISVEMILFTKNIYFQ